MRKISWLIWLWMLHNNNAILRNCTNNERRQLSLIPEAINRQAATAYEQFKNKAKLITKGKTR